MLLAALARMLPRNRWGSVFVRPETIRRWHRSVLARRWTYPHRRPGNRARSTEAAGYVFANKNGRPFDPVTILSRARSTWARADLEPLTLHECRHSYAAFMIAANVNAKALSTYMGHSTITITLDRYGHLLPGNEAHAANLLDTLLTTTKAIS
jgi:integrase